MPTWDIDRYEQLQDRAWDLDARANEQDTDAKRHEGQSNGDADRATARAHRFEAAGLLAQFWAMPSTTAPRARIVTEPVD